MEITTGWALTGLSKSRPANQRITVLGAKKYPQEVRVFFIWHRELSRDA
jgi:hypothetical protein